jgi:aspartate/methionine/tyrosine aminotransferase
MEALTGLRTGPPAGLERWFAAQGAPARCDLARSGAPPLSTADLLALGGQSARDELLELPLEYGDPAGSARLRRAIVASGAARHVDEVLVTTGAAEALLLAAAATLRPGDRARVAIPAYEALIRAPASVGANVEEVRVWHAPATTLDGSALMDDRRHRALFVNSPHNPTGLVWRSTALNALAVECAARNAWLIVDEVARGTLDIHAPGVASVPGFGSGAVIAIGDVSKAFGLGGLRIGWLTCADSALLRRAAAVKDLTSIAPAAPSQLLAAIALEHRTELAREVTAAAAQNRGRLRHWIARLDGGWCAEPEDGLVAFPKLPGDTDDVFLAAHLRSHHVGVVPGSLFGSPGHVRIALGERPHLFTAGLNVLESAVTGSRP